MANSSIHQNVLRRLRQRMGPWLDRFAKIFGQPTTHVYPSGYVGTVNLPIEEIEAELRDGGFTWDPISTYHYTPEGSSSDGSWAFRSSPFADRQVHVVLFTDRSDRTDVYAHNEPNWLRHPVIHAREEDIRRRDGVIQLRRWFDSRGLEYEADSMARRRINYAADRVRRWTSEFTQLVR